MPVAGFVILTPATSETSRNLPSPVRVFALGDVADGVVGEFNEGDFVRAPFVEYDFFQAPATAATRAAIDVGGRVADGRN